MHLLAVIKKKQKMHDTCITIRVNIFKFPSSSHGPKVAVIIVNGQHGVREEFEVD